MRRRDIGVFAALALLAIIAYLPTLRQPLLEDDFPNIAKAHAAGLGIVTDPIFGLRSTSFLLLDGIYKLFGIAAAPYYCALIALHVLNTWLIFGLGYWTQIGYRVAAWAAAFFAVCEGHQEAIMWVSAASEPLLFLFGVGAMLLWLRFLYQRQWMWYAGALVSFAAALYSKESAYVVVPLLALPLLFDRGLRRSAIWLLPFVLFAALAATHVLHTRSYSFRFNDGSFSLEAPFWLTWPNSFARLFWFWGVLALLAVLVWKPPKYGAVIAIGLLWAGVALAPYSFLTYATRIPSRQIYLASAGVALIVGCALPELARRCWPKRAAIVAAVCAVVVVQNVAYLWTKKRVAIPGARGADRATYLTGALDQRPHLCGCFPRPRIVADWAVRLSTGRDDLIWDAEKRGKAAKTFCYGAER